MICNQEKCIHIIKKVELEKQLFELRNTPTPADKSETSERLGCKNYGTIGNCATCYDYTKCDKFEAIIVKSDEPMAEPVYICDQVSDIGGCGITDCEYHNELKKPIRSPISLPCGRPSVKLKAVVKQIPEQQCQSCLDYKDEIARLKERLAECYDNPHAGSQRDLQIKLDQTTAACQKFNDNLSVAIRRAEAAEKLTEEYKAKLFESEDRMRGIMTRSQESPDKWLDKFLKMSEMYVDKVQELKEAKGE